MVSLVSGNELMSIIEESVGNGTGEAKIMTIIDYRSC